MSYETFAEAIPTMTYEEQVNLLANNAVLVTHNTDEFSRISELTIEDCLD